MTDIHKNIRIPHLGKVEIPSDKKSFFKNLVSNLFKGDKVVWVIFAFLVGISIVEIYSATSTIVYKQDNQWGPVLRHVFFLIVGLFLILVMHNIKYKFYKLLIFVLFIAICMLLLTPFIGTTVNGAERWISILGITIQPSEIAKISMVGTMAFLLSKQTASNEGVLFKWMVGLMVAVCGIILLDNLSTAVLLFFVCFLMMLLGGVSYKRLLKFGGVLVLGLLVFLSIMFLLPEEAKSKGIFNRFSTWENRLLNHSSADTTDEDAYFEITDDNYQVAHAKIAIANGRLMGVYPGNSKERDFLPQAYSDFIYAIIMEELGFVGGFFVLLLYVALLMRAGIIARKIDMLFPRYLVMGAALMLVTQAFMNMAVAVNLIPVTGQPLPLISRGGTSTIITCAYFGLILSASRFGTRNANDKVFPEEPIQENIASESEITTDEHINLNVEHESIENIDEIELYDDGKN